MFFKTIGWVGQNGAQMINVVWKYLRLSVNFKRRLRLVLGLCLLMGGPVTDWQRLSRPKLTVLSLRTLLPSQEISLPIHITIFEKNNNIFLNF